MNKMLKKKLYQQLTEVNNNIIHFHFSFLFYDILYFLGYVIPHLFLPLLSLSPFRLLLFQPVTETDLKEII